MHQELTPADKALVEAIFKKTGILTVKDKSTSALVQKPGEPDPYVNAKPYGEMYNPVANEKTGATNPDIACRRTVIRELVGTEAFPEGIPMGGVEIFSRRTPLSFPFGEKDFQSIEFRRDICRSEWDRLKAYATGGVFVTDEMRKAAEREAIKRTQGLAETQKDPVGALTKALAEALRAQTAAPAAPAVAPRAAPAKALVP